MKNIKRVWAFLAVLTLVFASCGEVGLGGEAEGIDKSELQELFTRAESERQGVEAAADGSEVPNNKKWVPPAVAEDLQRKITYADRVLKNPSATENQLKNAISLLNTAITEFKAAKKDGEAAPIVVTDSLSDKISEALALYNAASIFDDVAVDAPANAIWYPTEVGATLDAVIKAQQAVLAGGPSPQQVTDGVAALTNAITEFNNGKRTGPGTVRLIKAGMGASHSSVNGIAFRQSSMATYTDPNTGIQTQYIVYFLKSHGSNQSYIEYGKRQMHEPEFTKITSQIARPVNDAHDALSLIVDGEGYIHLAANHHNQQLQYFRGSAPGVLPMSTADRQYMIGTSHGQSSAAESSVTYVEFYRMKKSGNLLFAYRQGGSGSGYMVLNRWNVATKTWTRVHDRLLDGTLRAANNSTFSPYWQMYMDETDTIHLSWTFRETPAVETNANEYYTYSTDEGTTWRRKSNGAAYTTLPIGPSDTSNAAQRAEKIWDIPQSRNLMNQTNMTGEGGNPYILTYFSNTQSGNPSLGPMQYRVIYNNGNGWKITQVSYRTYNDNTTSKPVFLSGSGTITSPLSRPRMVVRRNPDTNKVEAFFICRFQNSAWVNNADSERRVSMFSTADIDAPESSSKWKHQYLTDFSVNAWEPSFDTDLWQDEGKLHVFVQFCRGSADGVADNGSVPTNDTYPAMQVYNLIVDTSNP